MQYRYWHDRFSKYGLLLKGVGDEGISEKENNVMYTEAGKVFTDLCRCEDIDFKSVKVLEIGCGTGFYTQLLKDLGVENYVGIDITDVLFTELRKKFPRFKFIQNVLFTELRKKFPRFKFIQKDVNRDEIEEKFDLILMIDVIEHIVNEDKLTFALNNAAKRLSDKGLFFLSPIMGKSKRRLFYVKWWSQDAVKQRLNGYIFRDLIRFRDSNLLIVEKNK